MEKFNTHIHATEEEFRRWNDAQPEERKIYTRLPFDVEFPQIKFGNHDRKPYKGKNGEADGFNKFQKIKATDSQGSELSYRIQVPSVVAPRGFGTIKTDNGSLDAILVVFDVNNPDHKLFLDNIEKDVIVPVTHEIMKAPGSYGMQGIKTFQNFDEKVLNSEQYRDNRIAIRSKMSKLINFPKKSKDVFDDESPLRTMFLNPLNYVNPEKPDEHPAEMKISLKLVRGQPARAITLKQLYDLCEGIKKDANGKIISQQRLGFKCSPEIVFTKINNGSKPSIKATCTAITITNFQKSIVKDTQAEKHAYVDEYGVLDNFTNSMNPYIEEMLAGLSSSEETTHTTSNVNLDVGENSLLAKVIQEPIQPEQNSTQEQNFALPPMSIPSIPQMTPIMPMQQQEINMVPTNFMGMQGMPQIPPMPPMNQQFNMSAMTSDRLNSFNPNMIPMSNISI